jgi:hypothetical protein
MSVDLPLPLAPMTQMISPRETEKVMPSSAGSLLRN